MCVKHYNRVRRYNITAAKPKRIPEPEPSYKICSRCDTHKPIEDYYIKPNSRPPYGHSSQCKKCHTQEQIGRALMKKYGITKEDYESLAEAQNHCCAICNKHVSENSIDPRTGNCMRLAVDHNHDTGKIRGLLCNQCNRFIGMAMDSVEILKNAIIYIERETDEI